MKNLKKVLALVLAFALVFGSFAAVSAKTYPDVAADVVYAPSVNLLSAFGIIEGDENGNFNPDAEITRAEFAKVLCVALGATSVAQGATSFTDVGQDHWGSGYINYATQLGIIKGYGDGTFGPEDAVTYEQAIKMIVVALGYDLVALQSGGYPTGYLMVAADKKITTNATGKVGEPALRSTVAVLLANGIDTPIMERITFGSGAAEYAVMDGTSGNAFKTLLTTKLDAYKIEGKIIANSKTSLSDSGGALKDEGYVSLKITNFLGLDSDIFGGPDAILSNMPSLDENAEDLIGKQVVAYVREVTTGDFELLCATEKKGKNVIIEIDADQAYDPVLDASLEDYERTDLIDDMIYSYWENDRDTDRRIKSLDINTDDDGCILMFNGVSKGLISSLNDDEKDVEDDDNLVKPEIGKIKFVDTDNDGDIDILEVTSYSVAIVSNINESHNRINFDSMRTFKATGMADRVGSYIILDSERNVDLKSWKITKDGEEIELKDIEPYDIITFVTDNHSNPTYYEIIVTRNVVEGIVTEIDGDEFYIDGEKYEAGCIPVAVKLEDEGKFYLDMSGKVVYVDTRSTVSDSYAYLYMMGVNEMQDYQVRIFNYEGKDLTLNLSNRIKINGVQKSSLTKDNYTIGELEKMFPTYDWGLDDNADNNDDGEVDEADAAADDSSDALVTEIADSGDYAADQVLTPEILLQALFGSKLGDFNAPELNNNFLAATIAGSETPDNVKFVTYTVSDSALTGINVALADPHNEDVFNYAGSASGATSSEALETKYNRNLIKFEKGRSIRDNTKVFYIRTDSDGEVGSIEDFMVKGIDSLKDEGNYEPFFFGNTAEGAGAVVLYGTDADFSTINSDSPTMIFLKSTRAKVNDEYINRIYYWVDNDEKFGTIDANEADITVSGVKASVSALEVGDVFIYDIDSNERINRMHVLFAPGTEAPSNNDGWAEDDAFGDMMSAIENEWAIYGDDDDDADAAIYFGYIHSKNPVSSGVKITLVGEDGALEGDDTAEFVIRDSADVKVTLFKPTVKSDDNKFADITVADIYPSIYTETTSRNIDFDSDGTNPQDMQYAFVVMVDDVVEQIVIVDYFNQN